MAHVLSAAVREILDAPNFAVLSTIGPDGSPHASVVWVARDGDDLLLATVQGRQKDVNIRRDARVSVTVYDASRPYRYVEVRGTAVVEAAGGAELNEELAHKYTGEGFKYHRPGQVRVAIRVKPTRTTGSAAGR